DQDARDLAIFTAETAERSLYQITKELNWQLQNRIRIITYQSHSDFQQTNVTPGYLPEGVGGFTELFKNRIVVPFEGDYEQYRHVIHHELIHGMMNDYLYGGSLQNALRNRAVGMPLWMSEGYAEHSSQYWDTKADMTMRDLVQNVTVPNMNQLNGYLAYKGGQSVWKYVADTYGQEKVGEFFQQIKRTGNPGRAIQAALGISYEDFSDRWAKYLRNYYWPDIEGRDDLPDIARQLTDHTELNNSFNIAPVFSPDGSKIAILSDRSGYPDIYILDAITGEVLKKVVSGGRSPDLEELKWLQPGITWSPDSKKIAFTSKAGDRDGLNIVNIETLEKKTLKFDVQNLFTARWSPVGNTIALIGHTKNSADIYLYDMDSDGLENLTNDVFSESEANWSPDGESMVFVSDRGGYINDEPRSMYSHDFTNKDIYTIEIATGEITRITETPYEENYPVYAHKSDKILYTSDASGIHNIYVHDLNTHENYAATNILTGIQQLSLSPDDNRLVFAGYRQMGWDVYILTNPFEFEPGEIDPPLTNYRLQQQEGEVPRVYSIPGQTPVDLATLHSTSYDIPTYGPRPKREPLDFSYYVFAEGYEEYNETKEDSIREVNNYPTEMDTTEIVASGTDYTPKDYKTQFTLDLITGNAGFHNMFGYSGNTIFMFSDILGDHQVMISAGIQLDLRNSDIYANYMYLKNRINWGFSVFHSPHYFNNFYLGLIRYRNWGGSVIASRPFNRYSRMDFSALFYNVEMKTLDIPNEPLFVEAGIYQEMRINTIMPSVQYVYDNTMPGFTGPQDGRRYNLSYTYSPKYNRNSLEFHTAEFDYRKYWRLSQLWSIAARGAVGISEGPNPQRFFLGGVSYWLNYRYRTDVDEFSNDPESIYFSRFITPIRGARYYETSGTRYLISNTEVRFPLIHYLFMGFPPVALQN
ncbi:MAG: hypothetical protein GF372_15180, partial [Candidatus Marinimicrobia bacterium]|nr:hypothetical protein [Candidatus Neomarinimicrobiota bacterium]